MGSWYMWNLAWGLYKRTEHSIQNQFYLCACKNHFWSVWFFKDSKKSRSPLSLSCSSLKLSLLLPLILAHPLAWISVAKFVGVLLSWARGCWWMHTCLVRAANKSNALSPLYDLSCSWLYSDAVWPRGWGRVHHGLQLPDVRATSLCYCPFKFWQQAGLWVNGHGWASLEGSRLPCGSQFLLVSLMAHTKEVRENAVVEDHSIAEEKVKGIFLKFRTFRK